MDNNTTVLSVETAAQKYAYENYGVPMDWRDAPSITQNTMSENIQEAYKEGYNSRNEEVEELVKALEEANQYIKHISDPFSFIQFGLPLLTKYNKTT
jgi:hypothetical protein